MYYKWLQPDGSVGWSVVPHTKKVADWILGQGTYLGCYWIPQLVGVCRGGN